MSGSKKKRKLRRFKIKRMVNQQDTSRGKYLGWTDEDAPEGNGRKLTRLQTRMVEEYVKDFNGWRAYQAAGGKSKGASGRACAAQILSYAHVQEAIRERQRQMREQSGVEAMDVVRELMRIAFADMKDFAKWASGNVTLKDSDLLTTDLSCAVQEVSETVNKQGITSVRIKLHPKISALKMLGEHLALFEKGGQDDETVEQKAEKIKRAVNDIFASVPTEPPTEKKVVKLKDKGDK